MASRSITPFQGLTIRSPLEREEKHTSNNSIIKKMKELNPHYNELYIFCPECEGELIVNSFEKICKDCGLVVEILYKESSCLFGDKNTDNRLAKQYVSLGNRTDFIGGLGSYIDFHNSQYFKDRWGKYLSPDKQKLFRRLKKDYALYLRIQGHSTEFRIFNILSEVSKFLNFPSNIRNNAAYNYKKIIKNEEKIINHVSLIAFCIYYAIRQDPYNAPITINELCEIFQNLGHRVNQQQILRDGLKYKHHLKYTLIPLKSEAFLTRLTSLVFNYPNLEKRMKKKGIHISKNKYQNKLTIKCHEIFQKIPLSKRNGINPFIFTGAVIYLADRLLAKEFLQKTILTQKIISEATNISEYSIRDHYVNILKPIFIKK